MRDGAEGASALGVGCALLGGRGPPCDASGALRYKQSNPLVRPRREPDEGDAKLIERRLETTTTGHLTLVSFNKAKEAELTITSLLPVILAS